MAIPPNFARTLQCWLKLWDSFFFVYSSSRDRYPYKSFFLSQHINKNNIKWYLARSHLKLFEKRSFKCNRSKIFLRKCNRSKIKMQSFQCILSTYFTLSSPCWQNTILFYLYLEFPNKTYCRLQDFIYKRGRFKNFWIIWGGVLTSKISAPKKKEVNVEKNSKIPQGAGPRRVRVW